MDAARGDWTPRGPDEIETLVRSLVGTMQSGGVSELDVAFGSVSIRLRAVPGGPAAADASFPAASEQREDHERTAADYLTAPMVGAFYASPSPGARPFIEVGDTIKSGQVIGIIEAMKIMNEISADRGGVVEAILVTNGQAVEYGSPLVRLRSGG